MTFEKKKSSKAVLNVTIDVELHDMLKEIMKEFKLGSISYTTNEILKDFKEGIWDVPEERKKLTEEATE